MSNLSNYFKATIAEMKQVSWPTQKQAFMYTGLVILISVIVSLFLGAFDFAFGELVKTLVEKF
jgi:preprotein translocase subunit SecE